MVPENLVQACFQQVQTSYVKKKIIILEGKNRTDYFLEPTLVYKDGTNVMGMIVFCIVFGLLAGQIGPKGKIMIDFFAVLNDLVMKLVGIIILWSVFQQFYKKNQKKHTPNPFLDSYMATSRKFFCTILTKKKEINIFDKQEVSAID